MNQAYALLAVLIVAFGSGWYFNGTRWEAKYTTLELAVETARADGEAAARESLQAAHKRDLEVRDLMLKRERAAVIAAQERQQKAEQDYAHIETEYREAIKQPDCAEWAAMPIACPVRLLPGFEAGNGDRGSAGAGAVATDPAGLTGRLSDPADGAKDERRTAAAAFGFTESVA